MDRYAELQVTTNYSFLRGGSHPGELVARAAALGLSAIAVTDRGSLAGIVRAHVAAKAAGIPLVVGARIDTRDGISTLLYPTDRVAYARLSRLLTTGARRGAKDRCDLTRDDLAAHADGLVAIALPPRDPGGPAFADALRFCADVYGRRRFIAATVLARGDDQRRLARLEAVARAHGAPLVATNDAHYHAPERRPLQDVLTAIRAGVTVDRLGWRRFANAERHLKPPEEMARLFARHPAAVARTIEIAARCRFSLDDLRYRYPVERADGEPPQARLERLTLAGAAARWPGGVPDRHVAQLRHEFALIAELGYAPYFLTVHEIVEFARSKGILCQGRGSAANSLICYCLGITAVDPDEIKLLFARFISSARGEPPDIDVDFEHERREEVIQWIYDEWGRERAALAATVISYRSRSAIRDVGRALGLSPDTLGAMADTVWGSGDDGVRDDHVRAAGLDPGDRRMAMALDLSRELIGFPRHLSQHVGGFVVTADRLDELVPIRDAAMEDRTTVEWDKDDLDALKILKIDVLALGMLTCIRKGLDLVAAHHGARHTLASIPRGDKEVYDMLSRGDSLGVFQVESRAQMSMLPRLRPRNFYDLVIQVAIVRPGPIQGDMVHPYLRRRDGLEPVVYPSAELEAVLERTLGVPLFQEQAMSIAMVAAKFSADDADRLRRAMATFRHTGTIHHFRDLLVEGMVKNGYERGFAERCFKQIEGFGEYGFPESHAASFASLVYASSWIKCHHPAAFACALLNSQPMGFYAPAQIVRDAREHGVAVLPPDVNRSDWDNTLEDSAGGRGPALRLGLRQIAGASEDEMTRLVEARGGGYRDVADVWRRGGLSRRQIEILARADAFASLDLSPRDALWASRGLRDERLPLFDAPPPSAERGPDGPGSPIVIPGAARDLEAAERSLATPGMTERKVGVTEGGAAGVEPAVALPGLTLGERIVDDYASLRLSLRGHPLSLLRGELSRRGVGRNDALATLPVNKRVSISGLVLVRQRPGSAKGVVFATLEDESGIANAIIWPAVFNAFRRVVMTARLLRVDGRLQRESGVIHVVAERLVDLSHLLDRVADLDGAGGDARRLAPANAAQGLRHRARDIVIPLSRADAAKYGSGGSRDGEYREPPPAPAARPAAGAAIPVRSRDFH